MIKLTPKDLAYTVELDAESGQQGTLAIYSSWDVVSGTLGTSPRPALGSEVHGDAGREQTDRDGEGTSDPGELDAAAQQAEIEDAEDEHENGSFRKEGRTTARNDQEQIERSSAVSEYFRTGGEMETAVAGF